MFHVTSSLFGGLAAVAAWALVAPSFDPAAQPGIAGESHERVNRAVKADRIAPPRPYGDRDTVATVEVIGVHAASIVYRDRAGRLLFQTDPVRDLPDRARRRLHAHVRRGAPRRRRLPAGSRRGSTPIRTGSPSCTR